MKYKLPAYVFGILLICTLQTTVIEYVKIFNIKPNLLLVYIVSVSLVRGNTEGAVTGLISGFIMDCLSGRIIGYYSLLGMYLGLSTGSINKKIFRENFLVAAFFAFVATIVYEFIVMFTGLYIPAVFSRSAQPEDLLFALRNIILPEAVYNSVISIFVYILVTKSNDKYMEIVRNARRY